MSEQELTFLFTDIERSTALVRGLGADYCNVLEESRALLRRALGANRGREVECRADESFSIFESAQDAVDAAADAQRALLATNWPGGAAVRIRMGVLTGTAVDSGHGFVGLDVHRAARMSAAGHGGQVLLSERTVELTGVDARDLGYYELPGLPEPERLFQLVADGLPVDFPPLRSARRVDDDQLRVVLADDSMLIRDGIARLLEEAGMRVVAQAGSGEELLEQVAATKPDVAVVDIRMPPSGSDEGVARRRRSAGCIRTPACCSSRRTSFPRTRASCSRRATRRRIPPEGPRRRHGRVRRRAAPRRRRRGRSRRRDRRARALDLARGRRLQSADEAQQALERRRVELAAVLRQGGDERELAAGLVLLALHGPSLFAAPAQRSFRAKAARAAPPTSRDIASVQGQRSAPPACAPPNGPSVSAPP